MYLSTTAVAAQQLAAAAEVSIYLLSKRRAQSRGTGLIDDHDVETLLARPGDSVHFLVFDWERVKHGSNELGTKVGKCTEKREAFHLVRSS